MISFPVLLLRLGVAIVLGSLVGLEREYHEHSAGMRTIALVTLGCALFTIVSAYGFLGLLNTLHLTLDPTRIASYIVAGIGFLGAGTIFMSREGERIRGLTTAATIWVMAAIGIACGTGMLAEASVTTALVIVVLIVFRFVEIAILPRKQEIYLTATISRMRAAASSRENRPAISASSIPSIVGASSAVSATGAGATGGSTWA